MILNYNIMIHDEKLGRKHITQDSDRNDTINHWIEGFSFYDFEDDHRRSRG